MKQTLPSIGSKLKGIFQPVEEFVGELTDILKQRGKEKQLKPFRNTHKNRIKQRFVPVGPRWS